MTRLAIPLAVAAAAALAACAGNQQPPDENMAASRAASGPVTGQPILYGQNAPVHGGQVLVPASAAFKPGPGTIESIAMVHILPAAPAAVAPGVAPSASSGASTVGTVGERLAYRLTVRMDDGSFQAVDQDNRNFLVGDRVSLRTDGRVIKQ